jgi:response regulator RpfG family c-di-GMP phosphodiesterase
MPTGNHLVRRLELPVVAVELAVESLLSETTLSAEHRKHLEAVHGQLEGLLRSLDDLKTGRMADGPLAVQPGEVDLAEALSQALGLLEGRAEEKDIKLEVAELSPCSLFCDAGLLLKAFFYLLRAEVEGAAPASRIAIRAYREGENAKVEVTNPSRPAWPRVLPRTGPGQDLSLAQRLAHAVGGTLRAKKGRERGTILLLPCSYRSPHLRVGRFQTRVNSRVQLSLKQIGRIRKELGRKEKLPRRLEESLSALEGAVKETRSSANSLALIADEMAYREQVQQDRVAQLELDQLTFFEGVLDIAREVVSFYKGLPLNPERARRVARLALSIASELRLSTQQKRSIYYGALLHELVSPWEEEAGVYPPDEKKTKERLQLLRALSQVGFLSQALPLSLAVHERFDGTGSPHSLKGQRIPVEARILAVADRYEALLSEALRHGPEAVERAREEIMAASGTAFDPAVADAFLRAWKSRRLAIEIEEVNRGA